MSDSNAIPPHPTLRSYYESNADRQRFVNDLFDRTSQHYDWADRVLSLGSGDRYRGDVLRRAGLKAGMRVIDIATGTGAVAAVARQIVTETGLVIGLDPSAGMLSVARTKVDASFVQAIGEAIALKSESFDLLTMGFALRHVADLRAAFLEYYRVLKPGGQVAIMELSVPSSKFGAGLLRHYMGKIVPFIVRLGTRSRDTERLMRYYWETTETCTPPSTIMDVLRSAGFREVRNDAQWGILSVYRAVK